MMAAPQSSRPRLLDPEVFVDWLRTQGVVEPELSVFRRGAAHLLAGLETAPLQPKHVEAFLERAHREGATASQLAGIRRVGDRLMSFHKAMMSGRPSFPTTAEAVKLPPPPESLPTTVRLRKAPPSDPVPAEAPPVSKRSYEVVLPDRAPVRTFSLPKIEPDARPLLGDVGIDFSSALFRYTVIGVVLLVFNVVLYKATGYIIIPR